MVYAMADAETEHFKFWLSCEIDLAHRQLDASWKTTDAKAAANGWYRSGRRIKDCIRSIADTIGQLADKAFHKASETTEVLVHHALADKALSEFLVELASKMPALIQSTGHPSPRLDLAVEKLIAQIRTDYANTAKLALLAIQAKQLGGDKVPNGAKKNAVALAVESLWQGHRPPPGLSVKDRNYKIRAWIACNNLSMPANDAALNKAVQRAIGKLH